MSPDEAETIAVEALGWLAGHDDLAGVFMGASGASAADLRDRASDPEFLVFVLDFLTMDDSWIAGFCAATGHGPRVPMTARAVLSGPAQDGWE